MYDKIKTVKINVFFKKSKKALSCLLTGSKGSSLRKMSALTSCVDLILTVPLLDALRSGRARERNIGAEKISTMLKSK